MAIKTVRTKVSATEPLSLEDAKQWLRVDDDPSADDALITSLITQTRELIEQHLNLSMVEYDVTVQATERQKLTLPFYPIGSVSSVQDLDGVDLDYEFDGFTVSLTTLSALVVTYRSGYQSGQLPEGLLLGWKEVLAGSYENRGDRMNTDFSPDILIRQNPNLTAYDKNEWIH